MKELDLTQERETFLSRQQLRVGETCQVTGKSEMMLQHNAAFIVEAAATLTVRSHAGKLFDCLNFFYLSELNLY